MDEGNTIKVTLLGTGGYWPDPARSGPATLVELGDETMLIDAGRGVVRQVMAAGKSLGAISTLFITHHHLDHIGELGDVMVSTWLAGRQDRLKLYGPRDTKRIAETLIDDVLEKDIYWRSEGEPRWGGWKGVDAQDVATGMVAQGKCWKAYAAQVEHGHGLGFSTEFQERWQCYGFRIEAFGKSLVLSGDTVDCHGIRSLAQDADLLIHCCFASEAEFVDDHLKKAGQYTLASAETVARIASDCGVKRLVGNHVRPKSAEALAQMEASMRALFDGEITIGNDLDTFIL